MLALGYLRDPDTWFLSSLRIALALRGDLPIYRKPAKKGDASHITYIARKRRSQAEVFGDTTESGRKKCHKAEGGEYPQFLVCCDGHHFDTSGAENSVEGAQGVHEKWIKKHGNDRGI